jgi:hypothetical protein
MFLTLALDEGEWVIVCMFHKFFGLVTTMELADV